MVRLPRPGSTANAVQSGCSVMFARPANRVGAVLAIIDVWHAQPRLHGTPSLRFASFCHYKSPRTHVISVYPPSACAGVLL